LKTKPCEFKDKILLKSITILKIKGYRFFLLMVFVGYLLGIQMTKKNVQKIIFPPGCFG